MGTDKENAAMMDMDKQQAQDEMIRRGTMPKTHKKFMVMLKLVITSPNDKITANMIFEFELYEYAGLCHLRKAFRHANKQVTYTTADWALKKRLRAAPSTSLPKGTATAT